MITLQWIEENLPLEQFLNQPEELTFFPQQVDNAFFYDLCRVWQQKNYWAFLLSMGPCVELIGYSAVEYAKIALYLAAGKEADLKRTAQGFFASERDGNMFGMLVSTVEVKNPSFNRSEFEQNHWTIFKSFSFILRQVFDEDARLRLLYNLKQIQTLRNSASHGNIMQFIQNFSLVQNKVAPAVHFEAGDDGEIKTGEPEYKLMPLEETTPTIVYFFLINVFRDDSPLPVKREIAKLFVETNFIFALLMSHMEDNRIIQGMLAKL